MRIMPFDHSDLDHADPGLTMGWDPDAVAPPSGDVYEREAHDRIVLGHAIAICVGISAALWLILAETVARTHMLFGMPLF